LQSLGQRDAEELQIVRRDSIPSRKARKEFGALKSKPLTRLMNLVREKKEWRASCPAEPYTGRS
jgi:hypothetical protein